MGKFSPPFSYTGTVSNISVYKVRGSDTPIVRTKGGPTKRQIETKPAFATTRKNNMEFGGRAKITGQLLYALRPLKYLSDYNIAGPLNSLFIPIQELDTEHEKGQRNIILSKNPGLLQGFNLNRRTPFDTFVANQLAYTLSKETLTASITFPALIPDVNFFVPEYYPWYKFIIIVGTVEDMFYNPKGYQSHNGKEMYSAVLDESDWLTVHAGAPAVTKQYTQLQNAYGGVSKLAKLKSYSMLLAVGIAFGTMQKGKIEMVKYVGGAKILGMA
ncbi:MAG TPA: hypothetical protein VF008_02305 [Niastella sp.]